MTRQGNRPFTTFRVLPNGIDFTGLGDFFLRPGEIQALLPDGGIPPQTQSVTLWCGMALARLLYLACYVKTLGGSCQEILLVGGVPLWLAHRMPFSDIDFIVSKRLMKPVHDASLHSILRPKLDLQAAHSLEMTLQEQDLTTIPLELGNERFRVMDPISAALGRLYILNPQRFLQKDIPLIHRVIYLHGISGLEQVRVQLTRILTHWHLTHEEKECVQANYHELLRSLESHKVTLPNNRIKIQSHYSIDSFFP